MWRLRVWGLRRRRCKESSCARKTDLFQPSRQHIIRVHQQLLHITLRLLPYSHWMSRDRCCITNNVSVDLHDAWGMFAQWIRGSHYCAAVTTAKKIKQTASHTFLDSPSVWWFLYLKTEVERFKVRWFFKALSLLVISSGSICVCLGLPRGVCPEKVGNLYRCHSVHHQLIGLSNKSHTIHKKMVGSGL